MAETTTLRKITEFVRGGRLIGERFSDRGQYDDMFPNQAADFYKNVLNYHSSVSKTGYSNILVFRPEHIPYLDAIRSLWEKKTDGLACYKWESGPYWSDAWILHYPKGKCDPSRGPEVGKVLAQKSKVSKREWKRVEGEIWTGKQDRRGVQKPVKVDGVELLKVGDVYQKGEKVGEDYTMPGYAVNIGKFGVDYTGVDKIDREKKVFGSLTGFEMDLLKELSALWLKRRGDYAE